MPYFSCKLFPRSPLIEVDLFKLWPEPKHLREVKEEVSMHAGLVSPAPNSHSLGKRRIGQGYVLAFQAILTDTSPVAACFALS